MLAQAPDRGSEEAGRGWVAAAGGEAGTGQLALGPQHRGQVPGLVVVEQDEQLADGVGIAQVVGGAGGQRPCPAQGFVPESEGVGLGEGGTGAAEGVLRPAGGGGREGFRDADYGLILGKLRWPASWQMRPAWSQRLWRRRRAALPPSP